ncbi:VPLPA-CTERM sorting domain-containing protein [Rhodobacteraceae bacterium F11138]|nr:VPLPA-CTERM sorting domain-containing protein [Rhodobacteraceae bacterium F11138]
MKLSTFAAAGTAAFLCMAAPAAYAATVFDLTGTGGTDSSYDFNEDGIGLTVTGMRDFFGWGSADIHQTNEGLGVTGWLDTSDEADGQFDEYMLFSFDQDVSMMEIAFNHIDSDDPYNIYVDSGSGFTLVDANAMTNPYTFSPFLTGNTLKVAVTDNSSAFRIASVTVNTVPVPAAGVLLLAGLGSLAAVRRRRKH